MFGDPQVLAQCLFVNAETLEELRLGALGWKNELIQSILHYQGDRREALFPRLRCLILSSMIDLSPNGTSGHLSLALNFSKLRTLKLRNCYGICELMSELSSSKPAMQLHTLEVVDTEYENYSSGLIIGLAKFVDSWRGLRELFIKLHFGDSEEAVRVSRAITSHKGTLESLVHHFRTMKWPSESPEFEMDQDPFLLLDEPYAQLLKCSSLRCIAGIFLPLVLVCAGCHPSMDL